MHAKSKRRFRYPRGVWLWGPAALFILAGAVALWQLPQPLLDHWVGTNDPEEQRKLLGTAAQIILLAMGGIIAVIGVALSLARHGQSLEAAEMDRARHDLEVDKEENRRAEIRNQQDFESRREDNRIAEVERQRQSDRERELRSRFVSAVDLLSTSAPIKRTAGLYALAALADDWASIKRTDEVQVCIDVLCGYLRAGAPSDPLERSDETDVRRTGFDLIRTHLLRVDDKVPWAGHRFALQAAPIWFDVDLSSIRCSRQTLLLLDECTLSENSSISFRDARITDGSSVSLYKARIGKEAIVTFHKTKVSDRGRFSLSDAFLDTSSVVEFGESELTSGVLDLSGVHAKTDVTILGPGTVVGPGSELRAFGMKIDPGANVFLESLSITGGRVDFVRTTLGQKATLTLSDMTVDGGLVALYSVALDTGASVRLDRSRFFTSHSLDLQDMNLEGGLVTVSGSIFTSGALVLPSGRVEVGGTTPQVSGAVLFKDGIAVGA